MAVMGIGIDMADTRLFAQELRRTSSPMLEDVFSPEERRQATEGSVPAHEILAGKFAAKEALYKAFGGTVSWEEITGCEVVHDSLGRPFFRLTENLLSTRNMKIHLSISHENGMAIAMVVLEVQND